MDVPERYHRIREYPGAINAVGVVIRLLDGLGFRFHWATEGLTLEDYDFLPPGGVNSMATIVGHIWGLMNWVMMNVLGEPGERPVGIPAQREDVLALIWRLRSHMETLTDDELGMLRIEGRPFWHMINGPISDALTHVGQINVMRRLLGKPSVGANVFTGEPPQ